MRYSLKINVKVRYGNTYMKIWFSPAEEQLLPQVFVLLQVGRCQIRDASANQHVSRPSVCACVRAYARYRSRSSRVRFGWNWRSTKPCGRDRSACACSLGRQICSPAAIARCAGRARLRVQPGVLGKIESHEVRD